MIFIFLLTIPEVLLRIPRTKNDNTKKIQPPAFNVLINHIFFLHVDIMIG